MRQLCFAYENDTKWAKVCFEYTDLNTKAVFSVMTNGRSDDCNGVNIESDTVWLQLCRAGDVFAAHYSYDGKTFLMNRILYMPLAKKLKVGLVAQSPLGCGGEFIFNDIYMEAVTKVDIRHGN
jgi:regulation of enolase protein 1 (concanavalin A-like superfamily)